MITVKSLSPDTNPKTEEVLISLIRKKSIPQRLSQLESLSSLVIQLSKRALARANPKMTERELKMLFVKLNYGENLFKAIDKFYSKIENETK